MAVLNIDEAASFLRMSRRSLETLAREGKVPATQLIGKWVFSDKQLQEYIERLSEKNVKILVEDIETETPQAKGKRRNPAFY